MTGLELVEQSDMRFPLNEIHWLVYKHIEHVKCQWLEICWIKWINVILNFEVSISLLFSHQGKQAEMSQIQWQLVDNMSYVILCFVMSLLSFFLLYYCFLQKLTEFVGWNVLPYMNQLELIWLIDLLNPWNQWGN